MADLPIPVLLDFLDDDASSSSNEEQLLEMCQSLIQTQKTTGQDKTLLEVLQCLQMMMSVLIY